MRRTLVVAAVLMLAGGCATEPTPPLQFAPPEKIPPALLAHWVEECAIIQPLVKNWNSEMIPLRSHFEGLEEVGTAPPRLTLLERLGEVEVSPFPGEVRCGPPGWQDRPVTFFEPRYFLAPLHSRDGMHVLVRFAETDGQWNGYLLVRSGDGWTVEATRPLKARYSDVEVWEVT